MNKNLEQCKAILITHYGDKFKGLILYGSQARDESDDQSDIDFLVEMEPGRSLLDMGGLLMDLQALLDCRVDVVSVKGLKARIRDRVLKEAVPV